MSKAPPVVVIGAGFAGLTAARELRRHGLDVTVLEAGTSATGLAASHDDDGFVSDTGAHFVTNRLAAAVGVSAACRTVARYSESVLLADGIYRYPVGLLRVPRFVRSAAARRLAATVRAEDASRDVGARFRADYGDALAEEIAIPLVEAWSGLPASEIAAVAADKIPAGIAHTVRLRIASRLAGRAVALGYCAAAPEIAGVHHVYPERGGVATLCAALERDLAGAIVLESPVERVYVDDGRAVGVRSGGRDIDAAAVVSTAPLPVLAGLTTPAPATLAAATALRYRAMIVVELRMHGRNLLPDVVNWVPDRELPFFRLNEATQAMPWSAPDGMTVIAADIGATVGDPWWTTTDDDLGRSVADHVARWVPDVAQRLTATRVRRIGLAYPIFALATEPIRAALADDLGVAGLVSIGRNGEFAHLLMEDVYWRTTRATRTLARGLAVSPEGLGARATSPALP